MNKNDGFILGRITKPFRYSGELILWMDVDSSVPYKGIKLIWLEMRKQLVPYSILKLKPHKDRFVVQLEGVNTEDAARGLCGKDVYLHIKQLPELKENKFYFHEVPGWTVIDLGSGAELGTIKRVLDHGPYPMLEVEQEGVELILPLPDNFKIEVDRVKERLKVEVPEGLVEVFLNPGKRADEEGEDEIWSNEE
jgi:16S rRNA processing protein RimM